VNNFARKFRNLLILLVTMAGLVAYLMFVFFPANRAITQLDAEVRDLRNYIQVSSPLILEIEEIESKMGQIRAAQAEWEKSAGAVATPSAVYGNVSELAESNNLKMIRFTPSTPETMSLLEPLGLSLTYTGKFNSVANFLAELETMPQVIWIDEASIQRKQGEDVQVALELRIFVDKTDTSS
jgi:Tfp pilus assembly protein PilO